MTETEQLLMKSLERYRGQLVQAETTGWYKGEATATNEIARLDRILSGMREKAEAINNLLDATKLAYRKHHLGDDSIGWDELSDVLHNALCEAMGDANYVKWLEEVKP